MRYFKRAAIVAFMLACGYWAGDGDYEEAKRAEATYKADFCSGVIPDYQNKGIKCEDNN